MVTSEVVVQVVVLSPVMMAESVVVVDVEYNFAAVLPHSSWSVAEASSLKEESSSSESQNRRSDQSRLSCHAANRSQSSWDRRRVQVRKDRTRSRLQDSPLQSPIVQSGQQSSRPSR